jgi:hypothetical protein
MLQVENVEQIFREYFSKAIIPDRIIELGTMTGRFSHIIYNIRNEINDKFDFITIDHNAIVKEVLPNMIFCQMDITKHFKFIGSLIKENTLVLCDNGNKVLEVRTLSKYLKKNCVIMAHDYFNKKEDSSPDNMRWPYGCEICHDDIKDLTNLQPYFQDIMKEAFWMSMKKI